jgi:hypothetical protein
VDPDSVEEKRSEDERSYCPVRMSEVIFLGKCGEHRNVEVLAGRLFPVSVG